MPRLGLGIGIPFSRVLGGIAQQITNAFIARVIADGGTFEARQCFVSSIQALLDIDIYPIGDEVMGDLRTRTIADSGIFEAFNCGAIQIQNLANIDL